MHPTQHKWGEIQTRVPEQEFPLLALIILALAVYWVRSFFGRSIIPGVPHTALFVDLLAVVIVLLIILKFLLNQSSHTFHLLMVIDIFSKSILS
jgi:hypothetical protein